VGTSKGKNGWSTFRGKKKGGRTKSASEYGKAGGGGGQPSKWEKTNTAGQNWVFYGLKKTSNLEWTKKTFRWIDAGGFRRNLREGGTHEAKRACFLQKTEEGGHGNFEYQPKDRPRPKSRKTNGNREKNYDGREKNATAATKRPWKKRLLRIS